MKYFQAASLAMAIGGMVPSAIAGGWKAKEQWRMIVASGRELAVLFSGKVWPPEKVDRMFEKAWPVLEEAEKADSGA